MAGAEGRSARRRRQESYDIEIRNKEIPKLKDLCLETDLSKEVLIVPPEGEAGEKIGQGIAQALGSGAEVRPASEIGESDWEAAHIVAAGNVFNNAVVRHLGMNFYAWTDEYYPGGEGYEVRTVHNPFGKGRNVVLLGGSTPEGVDRAVDGFLGILEAEGTRIGRINRSVSRHNPESPPTEAEARETIDTVNEQVALSGSQGPLRRMVDHAMLYYLSGQEVWGWMLREEFLFFIDLAHEVGDWCLSQGTHLYFWIYRMLTAWDVMEEGEVLSDADRLKMTNAIYNIIRWTSELPHFRYKTVDDVVQNQNHQSFAALSLFTGARYFKKYYGLTDFDEKLPLAHRTLELHARSYKPNDNAGTGYVWITPGHLIKYGMMTGDLSYLENGHLARLLDSAVLTIDSRGDDCSYGDVGAYRASRSSRPSGLQSAAIGAWFYNDGRYRWLYEWMEKGGEWKDSFQRATNWGIGGWEVYDGFFFKDVAPVEPTELLGVRASMLDRAAYELVRERARNTEQYHGDPVLEAEVPLSEAFDKLAFRRSFDRGSEYLLIDGPTGFSHSQEDGNSVIRLCWNDRIWLADLDYIRRLARYHNSVVIVKDGTCYTKPTQVALRAIADFEGWGYSQTVSPGDNGTDWARSIFWRKGRYFLVVDTVEGREKGDFLLDCIWRVLGQVEVDGNELHLEQDGERFHIVNADGSEKTLTDREADFAPDWKSNWENYEHADGVVRMWHQKKRVALDAGDRTAYVNLLYPSNAGMDQAFALERVGPSVVLVRDLSACLRAARRQACVSHAQADQQTDQGVMAGVGPFRSGALEVEGKLFRIDRNGFALVEGTVLSWEGPLFRSWAPVSVEMDLAKGEGVIEARSETRVGIRAEVVSLNGERISGGGEGKLLWFTLPAGRHGLEVSPGAEGVFDRVLEKTSPYGEGRVSKDQEPTPGEGLEPEWTFDAGAGLPARLRAARGQAEQDAAQAGVTAVASDGAGRTLVGTSEGGVHLLGPDGREVWSFRAKGEVRAVHLADIDGDDASEAIVGTGDCWLHVLDAGGETRWEHAFPPGSGMRPQRLMTVSSADLDGDGKVQVLAGAEGWLFHVFEADGTLKWQTETHYHCITGCLAVDLDGDGKDEVLVGTEYYTINCLNPDGTARWRRSTGCVSPTILSADLNGDGALEVIYGDWRAVNAVRSGELFSGPGTYSGRPDRGGGMIWRVNMGGEVEDIAVADVNGDGRPEVIVGSDVGQLACIGGDGAVIWRRDLGDKITWLTTVDGDGKPKVVVGFDTGEIRVYNGEGELVAGCQVEGEVTHLRAVEGGEGDRVVCATSAGTVTAFRPVW